MTRLFLVVVWIGVALIPLAQFFDRREGREFSAISFELCIAGGAIALTRSRPSRYGAFRQCLRIAALFVLGWTFALSRSSIGYFGWVPISHAVSGRAAPGEYVSQASIAKLLTLSFHVAIFSAIAFAAGWATISLDGKLRSKSADSATLRRWRMTAATALLASISLGITIVRRLGDYILDEFVEGILGCAPWVAPVGLGLGLLAAGIAIQRARTPEIQIAPLRTRWHRFLHASGVLIIGSVGALVWMFPIQVNRVSDDLMARKLPSPRVLIMDVPRTIFPTDELTLLQLANLHNWILAIVLTLVIRCIWSNAVGFGASDPPHRAGERFAWWFGLLATLFFLVVPAIASTVLAGFQLGLMKNVWTYSSVDRAIDRFLKTPPSTP